MKKKWVLGKKKETSRGVKEDERRSRKRKENL